MLLHLSRVEIIGVSVLRRLLKIYLLLLFKLILLCLRASHDLRTSAVDTQLTGVRLECGDLGWNILTIYVTLAFVMLLFPALWTISVPHFR